MLTKNTKTDRPMRSPGSLEHFFDYSLREVLIFQRVTKIEFYGF
jgi:hypothetical protein